MVQGDFDKLRILIETSKQVPSVYLVLSKKSYPNWWVRITHRNKSSKTRPVCNRFHDCGRNEAKNNDKSLFKMFPVC